MNRISRLLLIFVMTLTVCVAGFGVTSAYAGQTKTNQTTSTQNKDSAVKTGEDTNTESQDTEESTVAETEETEAAETETTVSEETRKASKKVKSVTFKANRVSVRLSKTKTLKVTRKHCKASALVFRSSNTKVVKVTQNGTLKPIKKGTATITVRIRGTKISDKVKVTVKNPKALYTASRFRYIGVVWYHGYRWTYYSQRVLPGGGLNIPGRHVEGGYVCDEDGYVVLASNTLRKGKIVKTPFGFIGKVYDSGCAVGTIDVYTDF